MLQTQTKPRPCKDFYLNCFISVIMLHVFVPGSVSLLFIGAFLQYIKFILMIFFVAFIYDVAKYSNPVLLYCCFKMCCIVNLIRFSYQKER